MNEDVVGADHLGSELMGASQVFLFTLSYSITVSLPLLTSQAVPPPPPSLLNMGKELVSFYQDWVYI